MLVYLGVKSIFLLFIELKNSGIDFKITDKRHFTPNVEYKSTLAKCKRLLTAFPMQKRMSMLFRAITDTVTDGRTDLTDHVGIKINLTHPNLGFLVRKIKAKQAAAKAENPERTMPSRKKAPEVQQVPQKISQKTSQKTAAQNNPLTKLPSGITVSKINKEPGLAATSSTRSSRNSAAAAEAAATAAAIGM